MSLDKFIRPRNPHLSQGIEHIRHLRKFPSDLSQSLSTSTSEATTILISPTIFLILELHINTTI